MQNTGKLDSFNPKIDASITLALNDALKISIITVWVTWVYFGLAVGITYLFFVPIVPKFSLTIWAITTIVFQIVWLFINIAFTIMKPNSEEQQKNWEPLANIITYVSNIIVIATIWLFLPYANEGLRLIMIIFYMAMAPTQILARPNNNFGKMFGIIGIIGSLVIFLIQRPEPYSIYLTLFILTFGVILVLFANSTHRLIAQVVSTRLEIEESKKKLEEALSFVAAERDAKTQFIAAASHDLGQPLQAASLFFDQVLRAPSESQRETAANGVKMAFASADQLLSHMLNHLRLEADAVKPHFSQVSLGPFLNNIVTQYTPSAISNGIEIKCVKTKLKLKTDRVLLERALGNLINNSIRHSGGKRLLIGIYRGNTGYIRIMIIDDGIGIGNNELKNIFEDYYRGNKSSKISSGGFGLGLSTVKRISLLLNGKSGIDTRWKKGAAFYIEFPINEFVFNQTKESIS